MVTDVEQAKEVIQEQLGDGGILATSMSLTVTHRVEEYLKRQCEVGGIVHNLMNKPKDKDDNMRGVAKMMMNKGDKLLPEKFDNEVRTGVLFRHWSAEMRQYLNVVDKDIRVLINIAENNIESKLEGTALKEKVTQYVAEHLNLDNGNTDKDKFFIAEFDKRYDGKQDDMVEHIIRVLNEQLHTFLMVSLNGEAKEMARVATLNGIEAWRALNYRWNRRSQFGATQVSEMIGKITPAKSADEVYQKLNQLERLHLELQKHLGVDLIDGVKVKVHYGEAFKKADVLRVLNEEFNTQLKKEGQELEKMSYQELIDRVQVYVRLNTKGKSNMDIGMINMTEEESDGAKEAEKEKEDADEDWWKDTCAPCDQNWIGYMGYKGGSKGDKGKGKGFDGKGKGAGKFQQRFNGACHACGKIGHRAYECRSNPKGGAPKGNSPYGKGGYGGFSANGGENFGGYGGKGSGFG